MPADVKTRVEDAAAKVRSVRDQEDPEAINREVEALMQVLQQVGSSMYEQQQAAGAPQDGQPEQPETPAGDAPSDEDVVEGEFKEE
mgnify:FL=1